MDPLNTQAPRPTQTPIPRQPLQSQGMPVGQPVEAPGMEMATPEERAQLQELLELSREKMAELQTTKFSNENAKEVARLDALKEVFQMMKGAGVDLTSQESVAQFIQRMKDVNPNLAEMFEQSLVFLLGEEPVEPMQEPMPTDPNTAPGAAGPMIPPIPQPSQPNNEAISQELRGPFPPTPGA